MHSGLLKLQEWYRLVPIAILAFALGCWGFAREDHQSTSRTAAQCHLQAPKAAGGACAVVPTGAGEIAVRSLSLIRPSPQYMRPDTPWQLVLAAILFPSLAFVGAFKFAVDSLRRDVRVVWAQRKRNHVIVCGLGQTGKQIVSSFLDAGLDVVAITPDAQSAEALSCEKRGVPVLAGDAGQGTLLKLAGLARASAVIVTTGSDSKNVEIGMKATDQFGRQARHGRFLRVFPQVRASWLYDAIVSHDFAVLGSERAELSIFNLDRNAARAMSQSKFLASAFPRSVTRPHLLLAGFGEMGSEVLMQMALNNFALPDYRLSVTILDEHADLCRDLAELKCSGLADIADCRFAACTFAHDSAAARAAIKTIMDGESPPHVAIVAVRTDDVALHTALEFRKVLDEMANTQVSVFVRLREKDRLGRYLAKMDPRSGTTERLVPFGDLSALTTPASLLDADADIVARAVHDIFRRYASENLTTNVPWAALPERFKNQNRAFADHIPVKLRWIGLTPSDASSPPVTFSAAEIDSLAGAEHWRWSIVLKSRGWRFAEVRDDFAHRHNRLVDWRELPDEVKELNRNMVRHIPEIIARVGHGFVRMGA
jgi:voltage-gated potassium channel Kch